MSVTSMMDSTCVVQRATIRRGKRGGVTQDPFHTINSPPAVGIACSYQEKSASKRDDYGQWNTFVQSTVYFAQDPQCEANDKLVITNIPTGEVVKVLVDGTAQPVARGRFWEVSGLRIREPK